MRKTTILFISAFALFFALGTGSLWADSTWSGSGSGTETFGVGHIHPFESWILTLHTDESPWRVAGQWADADSNTGTFQGSTWNGNSVSGTYTGYSYNDGNFSMTFNYQNGTCYGTWVTTLSGASGSGYMTGNQY